MKISLLPVLFTVIGLQTSAQSDELQQRHYNLRNGIAVHGYDVISYFTGKPREGLEAFKYTYKGITYLFASNSNLNLFKTNPGKYEPAYGGWCAYAMGASGEKVRIDPKTFKILHGKLYLFYNFWTNNTLEDWNENETSLQKAADLNWKKIIGNE